MNARDRKNRGGGGHSLYLQDVMVTGPGCIISFRVCLN